jgi:hypothetical protein
MKRSSIPKIAKVQDDLVEIRKKLYDAKVKLGSMAPFTLASVAVQQAYRSVEAAENAIEISIKHGSGR